MAFKAKKWVKPGSAPEDFKPAVPVPVAPQNMIQAAVGNSPAPNRKWVKPSLQAKKVEQQIESPTVNQSVAESTPIGDGIELSSEALKQMLDSLACLTQLQPTAPESADQPVQVQPDTDTASAPAPAEEPPSYWKVVRADVEAKAAVSREDSPNPDSLDAGDGQQSLTSK
jgi:hypothetical protein